MKTIDYTFLENCVFPANFIDSINKLESNRTLSSLFKDEYPEIFSKLIPDSIIDSIFSSNQLEGVYASNTVIKNMQKGLKPKNESERLVKGYIDAYKNIFDNYDKIEISEYSIYLIYKELNSYFDSFEGFKYRTKDTVIMQTNDLGAKEVVFSPTPPHEIQYQLSNLFEKYDIARKNPNIHPLFLIPCFICDFLCIQPYPKYNSMLARLLTQLLLLKNGYKIVKYSSWEYEIYANDLEYFSAMKESSISYHENDNSYIPFVKYFLDTLNTIYAKISYRYKILKVSEPKKASRIRETIIYANGYIGKEDIHTLWPDIAYNTIELELSSLLKQNLISKTGTTNGVSYLWLGEKKELKSFFDDI